MIDFVGGRTLSWIGVGSVAALSLGQIDFLIAIGIQLALKELGLFAPNLKIPGGLDAYVSGPAALFAIFLALLIIRGTMQFLTNVTGSIAYVLMVSKFRSMVALELLRGGNGQLVASTVSHRMTEIAQKAAGFLMRGSSERCGTGVDVGRHHAVVDLATDGRRNYRAQRHGRADPASQSAREDGRGGPSGGKSAPAPRHSAGCQKLVFG